MDLRMLEDKLREVRLSFLHQISLSGNHGYDPKLTIDLKKDIEWLEKQKEFLERDRPQPLNDTKFIQINWHNI